MILKLQPSEYVDQIVDGHEMTKLPYPFYVNEEGQVGNQELWRGDPVRVVGFQKDLARHRIDLWWTDAFGEPEKTLGMYLVAVDDKGGMGVYDTAIVSAEALPVDIP